LFCGLYFSFSLSGRWFKILLKKNPTSDTNVEETSFERLNLALLQ
jgi:hypothetical protein